MGLNATDLPTAADVINNTNLRGRRAQSLPARDAARAGRADEVHRQERQAVDRHGRRQVHGRERTAGPVPRRPRSRARSPIRPTPRPSDTEFLPAVLPNGRLPGDREHAGVISTHAWLQRFPTTPTNRNRHRVYILAKQFLATDVAALAARPIDDGGNFKMPTIENPNCAACHSTIDPMAASCQNWQKNNRYLPFRTADEQGSCAAERLSDQQLSEGQGRQGLLRRRRQLVPRPARSGLRQHADAGRRDGQHTALQWLGMQVAADRALRQGCSPLLRSGWCSTASR